MNEQVVYTVKEEWDGDCVVNLSGGLMTAGDCVDVLNNQRNEIARLKRVDRESLDRIKCLGAEIARLRGEVKEQIRWKNTAAREREQALADLTALRARLPQTADGVAVVQDDDVWVSNTGNGKVISDFAVRLTHGAIVHVKPCDCWSSRAAAEAARGGT